MLRKIFFHAFHNIEGCPSLPFISHHQWGTESFAKSLNELPWCAEHKLDKLLLVLWVVFCGRVFKERGLSTEVYASNNHLVSFKVWEGEDVLLEGVHSLWVIKTVFIAFYCINNKSLSRLWSWLIESVQRLSGIRKTSAHYCFCTVPHHCCFLAFFLDHFPQNLCCVNTCST